MSLNGLKKVTVFPNSGYHPSSGCGAFVRHGRVFYRPGAVMLMRNPLPVHQEKPHYIQYIWVAAAGQFLQCSWRKMTSLQTQSRTHGGFWVFARQKRV